MTQTPRAGPERDEDDVLLALPYDESAPTMARQVVRDTLTRWQLPDLIEDAELAVSELVTNALKHAQPPVVLGLTRPDCQVRIDVSDMRPATVTVVLPVVSKDCDESGRGRGIIAAVSDHSGTDDAVAEGDSTSSYVAWDVDPRPPAGV